MQRLPLQVSVSALLIAVVGVALNLWLFRFGLLVGLFGLSVSKHLAIAWLCQVLGVDRRQGGRPVVDPGTGATVAVPVAVPFAAERLGLAGRGEPPEDRRAPAAVRSDPDAGRAGPR